MSTMYIAYSATDAGGSKIGDTIVAAHTARLMIENEPHDRYILSLNPTHPLNFCFDQICLEYNIDVVFDSWTPGDVEHMYRMFNQRRMEKMVNGRVFDTYKEIYLRVDGGRRQGDLCGSERGLGRRNIFEYYFYGQESSPKICIGGAAFGRWSLGYKWRPSGPKRSVFVAPIAFSQTNKVFTMGFWQEVIQKLANENIEVTVNTPNKDQFGHHPMIKYSYQPNGYQALFDQIGQQRLVLCGNTGIGWIAGAYGVPLIAGEPDFFWFMDYRYRESGVQSVVDIFGNGSGDGKPPPDPQQPVNMVLKYLDGR